MGIIESYAGELAALSAAFFWTVTSIAFESAGKRVGALSVNLIRLIMALVFLSVYLWIVRGAAFPLDAGQHQWIWLSLSGLVGFVIGDLMLFKAFVQVGARISMLIMSLAPPFAAALGWFTLGERLSGMQGVAMALIFVGIAMVILKRGERAADKESGKNGMGVKLSFPLTGILLALGGALGQAGGLVLSKYGMAGYDVVASVQIRVITGVAGFALFFTLTRRWNRFSEAIRNKRAMKSITLGSFFGPFLGVTFSLIAIRYTSTGVASALMSIVPVLIIVPAVLFLKERVTVKEVIGAVITVSGVVLFFL